MELPVQLMAAGGIVYLLHRVKFMLLLEYQRQQVLTTPSRLSHYLQTCKLLFTTEKWTT
jgi:hypothetical protein